MKDILLELKKQDIEFNNQDIVKFATKHDIPLGVGSMAISASDLQCAIDITRKFQTQDWSGAEFFSAAKSELVELIKGCNRPANLVIYIHTSTAISLSEIADFMSTLNNYNQSTTIGYNHNKEGKNKLIAIIQKV